MTLKNKIMATCLAATMLIGLSGCSSAAANEPTDLDPQGEATEMDETLPTVTAINAEELALVVNGVATKNLNVTADVEDLADGAQIVFTYAASNETIDVDAEGNVSAVSAGAVTPFVTIAAKYDADGDGEADSEETLSTKKVQIAVSVEVENIELSQTEGTVEIYPYTGAESDVISLETTVLPEGASTQVTYSSSDESVAIVSEDGSVTGVSAGSATIVSTSEEGFEDSCEVTVSRSDEDAQAEADAIAAAAAAQKAAEEAAAQAAEEAAAAQAAAEAAASQVVESSSSSSSTNSSSDTSSSDSSSPTFTEGGNLSSDSNTDIGGNYWNEDDYKETGTWSPFG